MTKGTPTKKKLILCSWNVRGLGDPVKKAAVLSMAKIYGASLLCVQETHLTNISIPHLGWGDFRSQFHSVYTSFSRGVSILIKSGVEVNCMQSRIDESGRYIFLHCKIENRTYVLANVYIPPPFNTSVLRSLVEFVLDRPGVPVIVLGDFNMVMDQKIDRFPQGAQRGGTTDDRLSRFLGETGLKNIWRIRNLKSWQYSCFSRTLSTLSSIDLILGNEQAIPIVKNVSYMPRGLSDHSPMTASLEIGEGNHLREWRISLSWMELMEEPQDVLSALRECVELNTGTASEGVVWDTLKEGGKTGKRKSDTNRRRIH